ncbi:hypothetical protein [Actinoallomurus sp. NPDC052274]|uniref:hypothetical protein n=1 Tax=Actinoallomurus sp. NPDC052274 TaxID=3155420 RepID=UPI0034149CF1
MTVAAVVLVVLGAVLLVGYLLVRRAERKDQAREDAWVQHVRTALREVERAAPRDELAEFRRRRQGRR